MGYKTLITPKLYAHIGTHLGECENNHSPLLMAKGCERKRWLDANFFLTWKATLFMDPVSVLSLASTLSQLADHTGKVATSLCDYFSSVRHAPTRCKELREELQTVSVILNTLTKLLKPEFNALLLPVSALQNAVKDFGELLHYIERKTRPECIQGYRRFIWPLNKSIIERSLARVERHKATFNFALNVQQWYGMPN